jgi:hypothetical protein
MLAAMSLTVNTVAAPTIFAGFPVIPSLPVAS